MFSKNLENALRVKTLDCLVLQVWRNWRTPGEGSASVNPGFSQIRLHGSGGTLRWVPSVYSLGSARVYTKFEFVFLNSTKHKTPNHFVYKETFIQTINNHMKIIPFNSTSQKPIPAKTRIQTSSSKEPLQRILESNSQTFPWLICIECIR